MDDKAALFNEFRAYWKLSEDLIAEASKEDLAEVARILALQAAHYARKHGELPIPDLTHLLTQTNAKDLGLLRDGTEALVGVLAMVTGAGGVDINAELQ